MKLSILLLILVTFFITQLLFGKNKYLQKMSTYKLLSCCLFIIFCSIIVNVLLVIPSSLLIIIATVFATALLLIHYLEKVRKM